MTTDKQPPRRFEVRFTVDEYMGAIYTRLTGLPAKYRHREALSAARAYFEGRGLIPMASSGVTVDGVDFRSGSPGGPTKPGEGIATVQGLDALVEAMPDEILAGPPGLTHGR